MAIPLKRIIVHSALLLILVHCPFSLATENQPHTYATGSVLELDRCASAWLIKRFVDQKAIFRFYPEGEFVTEGVAFDTPDAELSRTHNLSTFEVIAQKFDINDPKVKRLARIVNDVEVNYWGQKKVPVSETINRDINRIIDESENQHQGLQDCIIYFDRLLSEF